jgi:hypothetical protein
MMLYRTTLKSLAAALAAVSLLASAPAGARERKEILAPVFSQYSSVWSAKRSLLKLVKKNKPLSGSDYYVLGVMCQADEPASESVILTLAHKANCKDKVADYFVAAGDHGVPEAFVDIGKHLADPAKALLFAEVAYLVSPRDAGLQAEADGEIEALTARLPDGAAQAKQIEAAAGQYARRLVAGHVYPTLGDLALSSAGARHGPAKLTDNFPDYFWMAFAPKHVLDVAEWAKEYRQTYLCPDAAAARAVVKAIPDSDKVPSSHKETLFDRALKAQHCAVAKSGKFRPAHLYEERTIVDEETGEPLEAWAAIAANDTRGKPVGLIFNDSEF